MSLGRVIATTIKQELPKGFQRSEFLEKRGQIDRIVTRDKMRDELARLVAYFTGADPVAAYGPWNGAAAVKEPVAEEKPKAKKPRAKKPKAKTKE